MNALTCILALIDPWVGPPSSDPGWPELARLMPKLASFKTSADSRENARRFNRLLAREGLLSKWTGPETERSPGLHVWYDLGVAQLKGLESGLLVYLYREPSESALLLFSSSGGRMKCEELPNPEFETQDAIMPENATLWRDKLIVSGAVDWMSNSWNTCVRTYRRSAKGWMFDAERIAQYESGDGQPIRISKGGAPAPIQIESQTYPLHLTACHAEAHFEYLEEWRFKDGVAYPAWKRALPTTLNTLDHLYGAILRRDNVYIRSHSLSKNVAEDILRLKSSGPDEMRGRIRYLKPSAPGSQRTFGIADLGRTFHFVRRNRIWVVARLGSLNECELDPS